MVGIRDLRRDVALADLLHVFCGEVQRADHGVQNVVDAAHDVAVRALELIVLAALGEFAFRRSLGQPGQFLLQTLQNQSDVVDGLLHLLVIALVGLGNQLVDLAV